MHRFGTNRLAHRAGIAVGTSATVQRTVAVIQRAVFQNSASAYIKDVTLKDCRRLKHIHGLTLRVKPNRDNAHRAGTCQAHRSNRYTIWQKQDGSIFKDNYIIFDRIIKTKAHVPPSRCKNQRFMATTADTTTQRGQISNPHSKENRATYNMGAFEQLFHDLGFRTGYDNYHMDQDNLAAQWESQNQSLGYEENYNSAEQAAARMREAGINPDIQGIENAGQAAEMAENELPPTQGVNELETAGNIAGKLGMTLLGILTDGATNVANAIGMTVGLMDKYEGLETRRTERDTKDVELTQKFLNLVPELQRYYNEIMPDAEPTDIKAAIKQSDAAKFWSKKLGMSRRNSQRLLDTYNYILDTTPSRIKRAADKLDEQTITYQSWLTDETKKVNEVVMENQVQKGKIDAKYLKAEAELYEKFPGIPMSIITGEKNLEMAQNTTGIDIAKAKSAAAAYQKLQSNKLKEIAELDYKTIQEYEEGLKNNPFHVNLNPDKWYYYRRATDRQFNKRLDMFGKLEEDAEIVGKFVRK